MTQQISSVTSEESSPIWNTICKLYTCNDVELLIIDISREKDVRDHLKNVYSTLTIALIAAMVGVGANHIYGLYSWSFLFAIAQFGLIFALTTTPFTRENENKRLAYLLGFSFLVGCNTGPLVEIVGADDPSIVVNAYLITLIVFASFTFSALYAQSTKYLYLGGMFAFPVLDEDFNI